MRRRRPLTERFMEKVDQTETCWLWTAAKDPQGYGRFGVEGKSSLAHRVAYELLVAPIADGMTIDHLCRVPACVNPAHLEAVSLWENTRRGEGPFARAARKTQCPAGHPYDETNTRLQDGKRRCRTCDRKRNWNPIRQQRRHAKEAAIQALIAAHPVEFSELWHQACVDQGLY